MTYYKRWKPFIVLAFLLGGLLGNTSDAAASTSGAFFVRIHPSRANMMDTLTSQESAIVKQHFTYWQAQLKQHALILGGPVPIDPGTFGILILRVPSLLDAEKLMENDPAMQAHVMSYEIYPLSLVFCDCTH